MRCVKLFTLPSCPLCYQAKQLAKTLLNKHGVSVETYDMSTPEGLADGLFYEVMSTPLFLVVEDLDESDQVIASWPGRVPSAQEVLEALS